MRYAPEFLFLLFKFLCLCLQCVCVYIDRAAPFSGCVVRNTCMSGEQGGTELAAQPGAGLTGTGAELRALL